ncbi:helix-turn-helix transcriptional regulator [Novosphingobium terrae]|uniref:helix-turn-helix transcriptional regulator n=1 Tax=Novosphingobium terrae TaxID=2726189 RepID=UPI00197CF1B2|nr:autoinducer binding domain-containing protein [Novosphingobium terrae]
MSIENKMIRFKILEDFKAEMAVVDSVAAFRRALIEVKTVMGFDYVALTQHADIFEGVGTVIRVHDYPALWALQFDGRRMGRTDPVHRASHTQAQPFLWTEISNMIQMRREDWAVFANAEDCGIGDGYTVPVHVPGESNGSVSFAMAVGRPIPYEMLAIAPQIALHAFDAARRLWKMRPAPLAMPILTAAQIRCLTWSMLGKSDWEISQIEKCQEVTVKKHAKDALARYGVHKRTLLITRTLLDGTLSLGDLAAG